MAFSLCAGQSFTSGVKTSRKSRVSSQMPPPRTQGAPAGADRARRAVLGSAVAVATAGVLVEEAGAAAGDQTAFEVVRQAAAAAVATVGLGAVARALIAARKAGVGEIVQTRTGGTGVGSVAFGVGGVAAGRAVVDGEVGRTVRVDPVARLGGVAIVRGGAALRGQEGGLAESGLEVAEVVRAVGGVGNAVGVAGARRSFQLAGRVAAVAGRHAAVVALLSGFLHAVAADRAARARADSRQAGVGRGAGVGVVTARSVGLRRIVADAGLRIAGTGVVALVERSADDRVAARAGAALAGVGLGAAVEVVARVAIGGHVGVAGSSAVAGVGFVAAGARRPAAGSRRAEGDARVAGRLRRIGALTGRGVAGPGVITLVERGADHRIGALARAALAGVALGAGVEVVAGRAVRLDVVDAGAGAVAGVLRVALVDGRATCIHRAGSRGAERSGDSKPSVGHSVPTPSHCSATSQTLPPEERHSLKSFTGVSAQKPSNTGVSPSGDGAPKPLIGWHVQMPQLVGVRELQSLSPKARKQPWTGTPARADDAAKKARAPVKIQTSSLDACFPPQLGHRSSCIGTARETLVPRRDRVTAAPESARFPAEL